MGNGDRFTPLARNATLQHATHAERISLQHATRHSYGFQLFVAKYNGGMPLI